MGVPFFDLESQHAALRTELREALSGVIDSCRFILGDEVAAIECAIAAYSGVAHGVGVSSGTDALLAALMAAGVGPGDEVVTTPYSFVATAMVVARLGARARFVDIDPSSLNIDVDRAAAEVGPRTKAVIPVHLFGRCAPLAPLVTRARHEGAVVIEDAAQALGADHASARAGSMGDMGCFSFFPTKNLGALGDAGMVVTSNTALAERLRVLRVQGQSERHHSSLVGGNFRLDALQAAALRVKLPHLDRWTAARRTHAAAYLSSFAEAGVASSLDAASLGHGLAMPETGQGRHVFNQFIVRTSRRDALRAFLGEREIGCDVYYPRPLHLHRAFEAWGYRDGDFPHAERAARETLALPIYPELSPAQLAEVVDAVVAFFA